MNILVLDNQPLQIESLARGLRIAGYSVYPATSGRIALEHLRRGDPSIDLIITDDASVLPDSADLIRHMSCSDRCPPVIMMTTANTRNHILNPLCSLCTELLKKPFDMDALLLAVEKCRTTHESSYARD